MADTGIQIQRLQAITPCGKQHIAIFVTVNSKHIVATDFVLSERIIHLLENTRPVSGHNQISILILEVYRKERTVYSDIIVSFKKSCILECSVRSAIKIQRCYVTLPRGFDQSDPDTFRALVCKDRLTCSGINNLST